MQHSSMCVCAVVLALGGDHFVEIDVQVREQIDCGREK